MWGILRIPVTSIGLALMLIPDVFLKRKECLHESNLKIDQFDVHGRLRIVEIVKVLRPEQPKE